MWIWFNKNGVLINSTIHGSAARVGTGDFQIFAYFDGLNVDDYYTDATIRFRRPDLQGSEYPSLFMQRVDNLVYNKDESDTDSIGFQNGHSYTGFMFDFGNFQDNEDYVSLLDTPGLWEATISLYGGNGAKNVVGIVTFNVEDSVSVVDNDPTVIDPDEILEQFRVQFGKKLDKNSKSYLRTSENFLQQVQEGTLSKEVYVPGVYVLDAATNIVYRIDTVTETVPGSGYVTATYTEVIYLEADVFGSIEVADSFYVLGEKSFETYTIANLIAEVGAEKDFIAIVKAKDLNNEEKLFTFSVSYNAGTYAISRNSTPFPNAGAYSLTTYYHRVGNLFSIGSTLLFSETGWTSNQVLTSNADISLLDHTISTRRYIDATSITFITTMEPGIISISGNYNNLFLDEAQLKSDGLTVSSERSNATTSYKAGSIVDGENTFTFPSTGGVLATESHFVNDLVPYTGAIHDVDLGEHAFKLGQSGSGGVLRTEIENAKISLKTNVGSKNNLVIEYNKITREALDGDYVLNIPKENGTLATQGYVDSSIEELEQRSDVVDVVGTYADLQNYDTSSLSANDLVKVINDSTHDNAISYYRWVITNNVGAWVYVASEGPFYTKSQTNTLLEQKVQKDSAASIVYGTSSIGAQTSVPYTANATEGALVLRRTDGHVTVPLTPVEQTDAASKAYVDKKENLIATTYADLVTLKTNSGLIPGCFYRITDYTCTTATTNTSSAGHVFDIIVRADDVNVLNEQAWAIHHAGDTYFTDSKLEAWQLWYCLDNDTTRFDWADSTNGKGVIYRMIDEFDNDCPYDFKNILFTDSAATPKYTNAYTFSYTESNTIKDASLLASKGCYSNIIKEYISSNKLKLNFNVFYSTTTTFACNSNTFGDDCSHNTFGDNCSANTFGDYCSSNTFGANCESNTFGDNCSTNTFGDYYTFNTFGNSCNGNTFGAECITNTFGTNCISNTFGDYCSRNIFGNDCQRTTFGDNCSANTFGNYCSRNTFGDNCSTNTFGNRCSNNTFGANCSINILRNSCSYNKFGDSSSATNYCRYNIIDNGCSYLYINSSGTASFSNQLQNIHIHLGITGSSSFNMRTITLSRGLAYSTDVYANNSQSIILND